MKLFIVIYLAGRIGGTVGPHPYDYEECVDRAAWQQTQCVENPASPYGCAEISFTCEWHMDRPANDPEAGSRLNRDT